MAQLQLHAAQRKKAHAMRTTEEVLVYDGMGSFFLAGKDGVTYFLQVLTGLRTVVVMGLTTPERLFIQSQRFHISTTIYHGTHLRIAHRQCLQPVSCRLIIP